MMFKKALVAGALSLCFGQSAMAVDCFPTAGNYVGKGRVSSGGGTAFYRVEISINPNSYSYTRTYETGQKEIGMHLFACEQDGTILWRGFGGGNWTEDGDYRVDGVSTNYKGRLELMFREGTLWLTEHNQFGNGNETYYQDEAVLIP
jgi:hypothetical protein